MNNFNYSTWYFTTVKYKRYKLLQIQTWYITIHEKQDSNRSFCLLQSRLTIPELQIHLETIIKPSVTPATISDP